MYTHVMVGTNDPEKARAFYDATFGALGIPGQHTERGAFYGSPETGMFGVTIPRDEQPATHANGGTAIEDPPGPRNATGGRVLYLAYLRDPAGNKVCALHRLK